MKNEKRIKDLLPEGAYEAFLDHCVELSDFGNNDMLLGDYITWLIGWTDYLLALKKWLNTEIPEQQKEGSNEDETYVDATTWVMQTIDEIIEQKMTAQFGENWRNDTKYIVQEPETVKPKEGTQQDTYQCPKCDCTIHYLNRYCHYCGAKIKWEVDI